MEMWGVSSAKRKKKKGKLDSKGRCEIGVP